MGGMIEARSLTSEDAQKLIMLLREVRVPIAGAPEALRLVMGLQRIADGTDIVTAALKTHGGSSGG